MNRRALLQAILVAPTFRLLPPTTKIALAANHIISFTPHTGPLQIVIKQCSGHAVLFPKVSWSKP